MNSASQPITGSASDHIMANTWRLIFEGKSRPADSNSARRAVTDFSVLEELLPEYRMIGLYLADARKEGRYN